MELFSRVRFAGFMDYQMVVEWNFAVFLLSEILKFSDSRGNSSLLAL